MKSLQVIMAVVLSLLTLNTSGAKAQQSTPDQEALTICVLIGGEVVNPGHYDVKSTDGVPELIALAGGPTREAATTRVLVERGVAPDKKTVMLDVFAAVRQSGAKPDFALHDGDFVIVPKTLIASGLLDRSKSRAML
jgi:protein involved in polysaccharide export with SLBB domain